MPTFRLGDDGTLDTVVVCEECGEELRYNYDPTGGDDDEGHAEQRYQDFVAWALEDAGAVHECEPEGEEN